MKSEQEFQDKLRTDAGRAEIAQIVNYQLPEELKAHSFARKAARLFKQQYIFDSGPARKISVPTFELSIEHTLRYGQFENSKMFGQVVGSMIEQIAAKENEVLVNIVKWSAEAAEKGATEGLKPIDADYRTTDLEQLLFSMGKAEVQPNFVVFHPIDYHRYCRYWLPVGEMETKREKLKEGIMGYFWPGAFGKNHKVTLMQSRFVDQLRPIILGGREEHEAAAFPNQLDIVLTERVSPTLSIEERPTGLNLTLKEEIGICASGKYVQQVRLPEWKEEGV